MGVTGTERNKRKQRVGVVVSARMRKTRVVRVERQEPHPLYGKVVRYTKKYYVHDEKDETGVGDKVLIVETRPMSRTKRWRLVSVVSRAPASAAAESAGAAEVAQP